MNYVYHWRDHDGIDHFTEDQEVADKALHTGYFVQMIPQNGRVAG